MKDILLVSTTSWGKDCRSQSLIFWARFAFSTTTLSNVSYYYTEKSFGTEMVLFTMLKYLWRAFKILMHFQHRPETKSRYDTSKITPPWPSCRFCRIQPRHSIYEVEMWLNRAKKRFLIRSSKISCNSPEINWLGAGLVATAPRYFHFLLYKHLNQNFRTYSSLVF